MRTCCFKICITKIHPRYWFCGKASQTAQHKLVHKHTSKHGHIVFSILLWFPCILGKLAARLQAQSDQLFKLPWALWVFPGFIRSSCWKFGTMKNMMHGARDKYHRDSSAMCHLMPGGECEESEIWFSKRRMGWCVFASRRTARRRHCCCWGKSLMSPVSTCVVCDGANDMMANSVWDIFLVTGNNLEREKDSMCVCLPVCNIQEAMCAHAT